MKSTYDKIVQGLAERITEEDYETLAKDLESIEKMYEKSKIDVNTGAKVLSKNQAFITIGAIIALDEDFYKELPRSIRKYRFMKDFCYICNYKVAKHHSMDRYNHYRYISVVNFDNETAEMHSNYLVKLTRHKLERNKKHG